MSRKILPFCLLFLLVTAGFAQPKLKVLPEAIFDIGDYYQGQRAEKKLSVKNVGTDTLRISDVRAQCGCTATMMTDKILGPGKEGTLSITFDTHAYDGKVTKQVYITSNDASSPKTTIQFTANVMKVLTFTPDFVSFDQCKVDSTYTRLITITNPSKTQSIKILSLDVKSDQIKTSLFKNELMPGEQTQLQVTFRSDKAGTFSGSIELSTDHPLMPKFDLKYNSWVNRK
ncbi:MAG TPA: DUF1573 domain-containing protein [Bacteroidota bacterium]|nr:DUF1573 domain-containing protein [Bacteroidota bacterium]